MNRQVQRKRMICGTFLILPLFFFPGVGQAAEPSTELATVNGKTITEDDIRPQIEGQMLRINNQVYTLKKQAVDAVISDYLLDQEAKKRGISRQQLLQQEVTAKAGEVTDEEVQTFYESNKARFGKKTLDELKPQIRQALQSRKLQERQQAYMNELRQAATVKMVLEPPLVEVTIDGAPVRGPKDAPITLVEFSDFQ